MFSITSTGAFFSSSILLMALSIFFWGLNKFAIKAMTAAGGLLTTPGYFNGSMTSPLLRSLSTDFCSSIFSLGTSSVLFD